MAEEPKPILDYKTPDTPKPRKLSRAALYFLSTIAGVLFIFFAFGAWGAMVVAIGDKKSNHPWLFDAVISIVFGLISAGCYQRWKQLRDRNEEL